MGERLRNIVNNKRIIAILIIAIIVIAAIVGIVVANNNNKIDLSNDFTIKVEGLDTQGTASYQIDKKSLETTLLGKNIDEFRANVFIESIKCNINKKEALKNGDKIMATLSFDNAVANQLNLSFKGVEKTIEVSGLPEGRVVDAFQQAKVSYTGTSPDGKVSVANESNDPFVSKITFSSSENKVANGDKIQISANYDTAEATQQRVIIKNNTKTYTVSGLPEYLSKANQLGTNEFNGLKGMSDEIIKNNLKESIPFFINHIPNRKTSQMFTLGDEYSYKNVQMQKAYIYTMKKDANSVMTLFKHNAVCTISSVDIIANGKTVGTTYMAAEIDDIVLNNGKVTGDEKNAGQYNTPDEAQHAAEDWFGGNQYNIEPIDVK